MNWVLAAFDKGTGELAEEYPLQGVTVDDLRRIFEQSNEDDMIEDYPVTSEIMDQLKSFLSRRFALNSNLDYYLQCFSDSAS
jgi:hypothetical protein